MTCNTKVVLRFLTQQDWMLWCSKVNTSLPKPASTGTTQSPGWKDVTSLPTSSTSPTPSFPPTAGRGHKIGYDPTAWRHNQWPGQFSLYRAKQNFYKISDLNSTRQKDIRTDTTLPWIMFMSAGLTGAASIRTLTEPSFTGGNASCSILKTNESYSTSVLQLIHRWPGVQYSNIFRYFIKTWKIN